MLFFFFKQKTAYEMRISDWSSDVCSSDLNNTLTAGEYAIAADYQGRVNAVYREYQMTVAQMMQEFGKDACSHTVQNLFERGALEQWEIGRASCRERVCQYV